MADVENETHSGDLPVYSHFLPYNLTMKKYALVKSSNNNLIYKHAETIAFADTLMSKFEDLTSKSKKSPFRVWAKERRLRKGRQSNDGRASSEPSPESDSKPGEQVQTKKKNRSFPVEIRLTRGKNAEKSQIVSQNRNAITGFVFNNGSELSSTLIF